MRADFDTAELILAPGSASQRTVPLPVEMMPATRIRWVALHPEGLVVGLPTGSNALIEMGKTGDAEELRAGRPIVYLDQNHWSCVGLALNGDPRVSQPVAEAAYWLAARVESGEILMPLSAGRLVETDALFGDRREAVAGALLRLSRGWHMRNPVVIRRLELARALGAPTTPEPVFVPGMAETFASVTEGPERRIPWALGLYEAMLDLERVEDPGGAGARAKDSWAHKWVGITEALRRDCVGRRTVAQVARLNLLLDAADDIGAVGLQLGMPADEVMNELSHPGKLEGQPMLALMLQVLTARLHNAGQRPERGDLFDFVNLPCAAAYADVLVGEGRMIGMLRGARRPPPKAALANNLPDAVVQVEAALASARAI